MNPITLFFVVGYFYLLHLLLFTLGGNVYDIAKARKQKAATKPKNAPKPMLSVVIAAYNEEASIESTLRSMVRSKYPVKKYEIIVVNNNSADATTKIIRSFIKAHPRHQIRLVDRRGNYGKGKSLNYAIKKYARGEIVVAYDADTQVEPDAFRNAVNYFDDPSVIGVASNVRIAPQRKLLSLLQLYEYLIAYRSKKFYTLINGEMVVGGVGSFYRHSTVCANGLYDDMSMTEDLGLSMKIRANANKAEKLVYASDAVAITGAVQTFMQLLKQRYRWKMGMIQNLFRYSGRIYKNHANQSGSLLYYRLPMAFLSELLLILEPILLTTAITLSVMYSTPWVFVGAWATITAYSLYALWVDDSLNAQQKLRYSLPAPLMYFLYYIMSFVQFAALIKCLLNINLMLNRKPSSNVWTPPTRIGANS